MGKVAGLGAEKRKQVTWSIRTDGEPILREALDLILSRLDLRNLYEALFP